MMRCKRRVARMAKISYVYEILIGEHEWNIRLGRLK
jgi:hypothetical protein